MYICEQENKLHIKLKVPEFFPHEDDGYLGIETSINHLIRDLNDHTIDGIYLPNTRWFNGEEGSSELMNRFANQLAGLADIFVNDEEIILTGQSLLEIAEIDCIQPSVKFQKM